jgi:integrase
MGDERDEDLRRIRELQAQMASVMARLSGDSEPTLFGDYATKYLASKLLRPTLRQSTKDAFMGVVNNHLIPRFGRLPLAKITNSIWLEWVAEEKKITRFFNARKALMEILLAAKTDGCLDKSPRLENPDESRNVGRVLSDQEVLSILWKARRPFRVIFWTFWKMGCRPREILRWEWSMIEFVPPTVDEPLRADVAIPARISKTGRSRVIPLPMEVVRLLFRRKSRQSPESLFVFPKRQDYRLPQLSYDAAWTTACRRARVENTTVYDFRRTFTTDRASKGMQLLHIAKYLDTSVQMLEKIYCKRDAVALAAVAEGKAS